MTDPDTAIRRETRMTAPTLMKAGPMSLCDLLALLLAYAGLSEAEAVQAAKLSRQIDVEAFVPA